MRRHSFATRRRLMMGLTVAGALGGGAFGVILTRLGKLVSGAPPASPANYLWNAVIFGLIAGIVSPLVSWAALRRVPLWRTLAEPLLWATAGGAAAIVVGVPVLVLVLPPAGLALGYLNLRRRYPEPGQPLAARPAEPRLQQSGRQPPRQR